MHSDSTFRALHVHHAPAEGSKERKKGFHLHAYLARPTYLPATCSSTVGGSSPSIRRSACTLPAPVLPGPPAPEPCTLSGCPLPVLAVCRTAVCPGCAGCTYAIPPACSCRAPCALPGSACARWLAVCVPCPLTVGGRRSESVLAGRLCARHYCCYAPGRVSQVSAHIKSRNSKTPQQVRVQKRLSTLVKTKQRLAEPPRVHDVSIHTCSACMPCSPLPTCFHLAASGQAFGARIWRGNVLPI